MAIRKRYYFWLLKAYYTRWKRTIFTSIIIGIAISALGIAFLNFYVRPSLENKSFRVGVFGVYTPKNLPDSILSQVSYGLTAVTEKGEVLPAAAERWEIKDNGKQYVFYLKKGLMFHNGEEFNALSLNLDFKDAKKEIIDGYTVSYTLSAPYAPFLATVSKPILLQDFSGLGHYRLRNIDLNAGFVRSLVLQDTKDSLNRKHVLFYPTQAALKTAYMLGEIDEIPGVFTPSLEGKDLSKWNNTSVEKKVNYSELVTLFYNNEDANLSNKKVRQALNYALPEKFTQGERAHSPIPPTSIYHSKSETYSLSDSDIAKELLDSSSVTFDKPLEITTTADLESTAKVVASAWEKMGVNTKIKVVEEVSPAFEVLLFRYKLPLDPDQYTLWHSDQVNNIGKYKNLRIDKLLEDGREKHNVQDRITIYADFQKYLLDDVPASFLYFPTEYRIVRE